jgi:hypothetical protein
VNALVRINWIASGGLAFMFAYHGLVPKLLWLSAGEQRMIEAHGIEQVDVAVFSPGLLKEAFNPVSLNVAGLTLCAVAWSARR